MKLAETVLATLPPGAPAVATATWDAPVAGKLNIEAVVTAGDASASAPGVVRVFARNAPVLLVDDDDGYTAEEAFEGALVSLGVPYVVVEKTAPLALMQQYDLVVWSAGQAGRLEGQLNKTEIADLKALLNAGGKVWFSSPRLAGALDASSPGPVDTAFLNDYLGAAYPMSNQAGGGVITGTGQYIGGTGSYELRGFPGRSIEDFLDPAVSAIGTGTMLFTWDAGHYLGTEVIGDAAHNNFHVVFFGFNMSQVIAPEDRMVLTQQVLDRMGVANAYFEKTTYFVPTTGSVRLFVHDQVTPLTQVRVTSQAQPAGVLVNVRPTAFPGTYTGVLTVRVNGMTRGTLKVNPVDEIRVAYTDAVGDTIWGAATTLQRPADELPAIIYHDLISNAYRRQGAAGHGDRDGRHPCRERRALLPVCGHGGLAEGLDGGDLPLRLHCHDPGLVRDTGGRGVLPHRHRHARPRDDRGLRAIAQLRRCPAAHGGHRVTTTRPLRIA